MAATAFVTRTDLLKVRTQSVLAGLADDDNKPPDWSAANTVVVVDEAVADANRRVTNSLQGRVDLTDSDTLASCKNIAGAFAVHFLYSRKYTYNGNPFRGEYNEAKEQLDHMRSGKLRTSASQKPSLAAYNTNEDTDPVFARNEDGDESSYLRGF